jgi:hypothetical protein
MTPRITYLAIVTIAPAFNFGFSFAGRQQDTRMFIAGSDGSDGSDVWHVA